MSRPLYENALTKADEQRAVAILRRRWPRTVFTKIPFKYHIDFIARVDGKVIGFVESKRRNYAFGHYADFMISLDKVLAARALTQLCSVPVGFLGLFDDFPALVDLACDFRLGFGGRSDRGDWQDQEPMAHFAWADFMRMP